MARIVMKFGGTSVGDISRIKNVAKRVQREVEAGNEVAVVVSAMSGTTNQLVAWTREISSLHDAREYDTVVATGEQVTVEVTKPSGETISFPTNHTFSDDQIEWFKAGSALNIIKARSGA